MPIPIETRFWRKVLRNDAVSSCWIWVGNIRGRGYGGFKVNGRDLYAHRWAYERWVGAIPADKELDHLCRTLACVNPRHLEIVSHRTNVLRGDAPTAQNAKKDEGDNGHPYTPENTYTYRNGRARRCRVCDRDRKRLVKPRSFTLEELRQQVAILWPAGSDVVEHVNAFLDWLDGQA